MSSGARLLILGPFPPPYGGIASQIANTLPYLLQAGFERVHLVSWGREDSIATEDRVVRQRIDLSKRWPMLLNPLRWARAWTSYRHMRRGGAEPRLAFAEAVRFAVVRELVREHRFDLVHYFMLTEGLAAPLMKRFEPRVKLALTIYGEIFDNEALFKQRSGLVAAQLDA